MAVSDCPLIRRGCWTGAGEAGQPELLKWTKVSDRPAARTQLVAAGPAAGPAPSPAAQGLEPARPAGRARRIGEPGSQVRIEAPELEPAFPWRRSLPSSFLPARRAAAPCSGGRRPGRRLPHPGAAARGQRLRAGVSADQCRVPQPRPAAPGLSSNGNSASIPRRYDSRMGCPCTDRARCDPSPAGPGLVAEFQQPSQSVRATGQPRRPCAGNWA
jgi:hypothetical protein